jgi:hypothetical protein
MAYEEDDKKDPRSKTTASVWGIACGMMAISIPIIALTDGNGTAFLPMLAIAGAAVSSVAIWFAPRRDAELSGAALHELDEMKQMLLEMHSHVVVLEQKVEDQELQLRITQSGNGASNGAGSAENPSASSF